MRELSCTHCGKTLSADDKYCPHCGMPLAPNQRKTPQGKFILWFIAIVIFCALMIYLLPFLGSTRFPGR
ncbi:DUF2116 family Zn-ribbon domain-containing protein [Cocleimonas sp. KMM 6892]|uniref:zinc-ribbon domain-containing protein n=1 Tax=unclassified Cocleimonas TaxID=2639732 RepID=UPI002DBE2BFF|nr:MULTISPECIES: DUF2116 family Zn-ribbon domain-containing protein [unclassified Cocleimonas]MEB8430647.1 DUF2116 family Zn-ribbon domain-containing protein [Cocleimonas sp. KMM 6892]MEC4716902.1 DUF2116 family Zn-ribbon domain-containing protein [Cocleimonas sp. KMM 6895]MEC4743914.1 DUF2116 family Zn-ribbon domain-containing protein [Cocleimonas sp. KMM 6896]